MTNPKPVSTDALLEHLRGSAKNYLKTNNDPALYAKKLAKDFVELDRRLSVGDPLPFAWDKESDERARAAAEPAEATPARPEYEYAATYEFATFHDEGPHEPCKPSGDGWRLVSSLLSPEGKPIWYWEREAR